jgi:hypothetical protein
MEDIRYPEQLDYRPIERRRPEPPLRRQLDGYSRETETGHLLVWLSDQKLLLQISGGGVQCEISSSPFQVFSSYCSRAYF